MDSQDKEVMNVVEKVLKKGKRVAVVGLSDKPERYSYQVAEYLQSQGYKIVPVNPNVKSVLGEKAYPDLLSVSGKVDVVQIFRRKEFVPETVKQAIKIGAKTVWMQEGISHEGAAKEAEAAGLVVVQNACMMKKHRYFLAHPRK